MPTGEEVHRAVPGLLAVVLPIAILAELLWYIEIRSSATWFVDIFIAAVLALIVANVRPLPARYQPGLEFSTKWFLRLGIIIYGLKFTYAYLSTAGWGYLSLVVLSVVVALGVAAIIGRVLGLPAHAAALVGIGTAICGVAAIMATAPSIKAKAEETALALGTILLWGTLGLLVYPLLATIYHINPVLFGSWTGATIHDLPQIIATATQGGGQEALQAALFSKLIRVAFIVLVVFFMSVLFTMREAGTQTGRSGIGTFLFALKGFPLFVLGFFLVVVLNTIAKIPPEVTGPLATWSATVFPTTVAGFLLTLAIIGICGRVTREAVSRAGPKALMTGLAAWVVQSAIVFIAAKFLLA
ncbi:MAG: putative sulfate exporter family transporter [Dehalococcoidia bacterium]|nr:putative sulfate exporter family transporter [Dehalococcoidia bacterium]